jgi:anti-anti-sigma factor
VAAVSTDPSRTPRPQLTIVTTWPRPDICLVRPSGELDLDTAPLLRRHLRTQTAARPPYLLLDLSAVTLLAAAGLTVLVGAMRDDQGVYGQLRVVGLATNRAVARVVRLTALDTVLPIHPTVDHAVEAIDKIKQS